MKTVSQFRYVPRRGQAAVEYVLALLGVIAVVAVMGYLVTAAWKSAERAENLVESDYP